MEKTTLMIVLCLLSSPGFAFNSYFPRVHTEITENAVAIAGWSKNAVSKLGKKVRNPDWDESEKKVSHRPNKKYDASHHFDRPPGMTDKKAFKQSAAYLRKQKQQTIDEAKKGKTEEAMCALGRALHVLQDFKSHSNYIDLTPAEQKQARDALMDEKKDPPAKLKLTGFNPNAEEPGKPVGESFSHDVFSKDNKKIPEAKKTGVGGFSKFDLAKKSATSESVDLLKMVRSALAAAEWEKLNASVVDSDPNDETAYAWVNSAPCEADGCFVSSNGITVEFPPSISEQTKTVSILGVPHNFFMTPNMVQAPDGGRMVIYWEIRPKDTDFAEPAFATVNLFQSEVSDLLSASSAVYYADPASHEWERVPGASVDMLSEIATFNVAAGGTYAIGEPEVPTTVDPLGKKATIFGAVKRTALLQNYPNPFNPETWLPYELATDTEVTITIYNTQGHHIRTLELGTQPANSYLVKDRAAYWNGRSNTGERVASGTYFYHFQAGDYYATRKMLILK